MAATRLTDSQKSELVARYRDGVASQELADAYGCSLNTVTRVVKATLDPADYEQLKQQRAKGSSKSVQAKESAPQQPADGVVASNSPAPDSPAPDSMAEPGVADADIQVELESGIEPEPDPELETDREPVGPVVLAITDADDFGDDPDSDDSDVDGPDGDSEEFVEQFVAVPIALVGQSFQPAQCQPLGEAALPASVYMLVDKAVELQAKPLSDFPELGQLPADEEGRQALMVFANPRQAKRHCGRTQRVIKVPDTRILERTAPYLVAQGITRVVMEGSLYSLPGS